MTERKISAVQLSMLLFLCSLAAGISHSGSLPEAVAFPIGMGLVWLCLLPSYLLGRKSGLLPALGRLGTPFALPVAAVLTIFCVAMAARVLGEFSFFMTSTVYPNARTGIFLICTGLACAYGAGMGLEPLARMGLWITVLAFVTLVMLAAGLASSMRAVHFAGSMAGGALLENAGRSACAAGEILLFLLLIPRTRGKKPARTALGWLAMSAVAVASAALIVTAALGPFAQSRQFPLHTAAAAAHFSPQGRMDLLYLFLLVFSVFTRASLWLYAGCLCLRRLFPRTRRGVCALICGIAAAVLGFLPATYSVTGILLSGWVLLFAVAAPLLLLLFPAKNAKGGVK